MRVNINRLANSVLMLLCLIAAGCSQSSKTPLTLDDQTDYYTDADNSIEQYPHARTRLKFNKYQRDSSSLKNTVWDRLLSLYSLPEVDNARIDKEIEWYLQHPASLAIIQQRAEPYLHHILNEVEAKGIPGELALLPVVESAFVPNAYSKAAASGLWQFIPSTGEEYGLQQNAWYDGRRDVYASTKAATTYLKELSELFDGDWLLALASYNCGKNRVRKSIEYNESRNLPTDYWSLDLPRETLEYVPKLLAVAKIFANAEDYNLHLQHIPNKPYFEVVDIKSPLDLRMAALLANTPYDKFLKLNPGFNRSCTAPQGPHRLLIPIDNAQTFKRNLAQLPYDKRVDYAQLLREQEPTQGYSRAPKPKFAASQSKPETSMPALASARQSQYKVKRGDTLSVIASKTDTTVAELRRINHLKGNVARLGTLLKIPGSATMLASSVLPSKAGKTITVSNPITYTVKRGDTFSNIAQRFSVPPKDLAAWNKISVKTPLLAGRKLTLKAPSSRQQYANASASVRLIHYQVHKGDTLTKIARKFNVSVDDLRKSNPELSARGGVRYGQKLKVIVDGQSPT